VLKVSLRPTSLNLLKVGLGDVVNARECAVRAHWVFAPGLDDAQLGREKGGVEWNGFMIADAATLSGTVLMQALT
jgi:hypothetical protein